MEGNKKKRGENWSNEEKEILRGLINVSANILEDKSNKTNANILKTKEWKNVSNKFNELSGKTRSETEIKLAWKRMKMAAKANLSNHKRALTQTGGGRKPPSPSPEDLEIMAIAPLDFIEDTNTYDSDAGNPVPIVTNDSAQAGSSLDEPPLIVVITEEEIQEQQEISTNKDKDVNQVNTQKKKKLTASQHRNEERQEIIKSNINFKKRNLEMLEVEHKNKIKISQLKIKKLQLEIEILEHQKRQQGLD